MESGESGQMNTNEAFRLTPGGLPMRFLNPPSPYEDRRGSLASSTSSYCQSYTSSDYSEHTDFTMPITPTQGRSPLSQEGAVDIVPYDMSQSMNGLPMIPRQENVDNSYTEFVMVPSVTRGIPALSQPREYAATDTFYDSFGMVPPATVSSMPFISDLSLPTSAPMSHYNSSETSWDNVPTAMWPETSRGSFNLDSVSRRVEQLSPGRQEEFQGTWGSTTSNLFNCAGSLTSGTIMPSDAMMEDFVMIQPGEYDNSSSMGNDEPPNPQSPQEISYQREDSLAVKQESDVEPEPIRMETRMYVRSTGAKGVKKDRRTTGSARRKSRSPKYKEYEVPNRGGDGLVVKFEEGIVEDEVTGKLRRVGGGRDEAHGCPFCKRVFKRPEHLKRHVRTHDPNHVEASCCICLGLPNPKVKKFNRNDNWIAHISQTHLKQPGKREGRNQKYPLGELVARLRKAERREENPHTQKKLTQLIDKLQQKYGWGPHLLCPSKL